MITVGEIFQLLKQAPPRILEGETIGDAIEVILADTRVSSVYVVDGRDNLKGILDIPVLLQLASSINKEFERNESISTDSEAFLHMLGKLLDAYKVSTVMKPPISIRREEPISLAITLMKENNVHELPVVEGERLIGVLNFCEILYNLKR